MSDLNNLSHTGGSNDLDQCTNDRRCLSESLCRRHCVHTSIYEASIYGTSGLYVACVTFGDESVPVLRAPWLVRTPTKKEEGKLNSEDLNSRGLEFLAVFREKPDTDGINISSLPRPYIMSLCHSVLKAKGNYSLINQ